MVSWIDAGPKADRTTSGFAPDGLWQLEVLAERYAESGRTLEYLGDWHSHADGSVTSSFKDLRAAVGIARTPLARAPQPLMVIFRSREGRWDLAAWHLHRIRLHPCAVEIRELEVAEPAVAAQQSCSKSMQVRS